MIRLNFKHAANSSADPIFNRKELSAFLSRAPELPETILLKDQDLTGKRFTKLARALQLRPSGFPVTLKCEGSTLSPLGMKGLLKLHEEGKIILDLSGSFLKGNFWGFKFKGVNLAGADFKAAILYGASFESSILCPKALAQMEKYVYYSRRGSMPAMCLANCFKAVLQGDFSGFRFSFLYLVNFDLEGFDLAGANFTKIVALRGTSFKGANLSSAIFIEADVKYAVFEGANCSKADFSYANFQPDEDSPKLDLRTVTIEGANFTGAILVRVDLSDVNGAGLILRRAVLDSSDFQRANLAGADLEGASLKMTLFSASIDSETNMRNVFILGTDFSGLQGSINLENWHLRFDAFLSFTPQGRLDLLFNHLANQTSILSAIQSIPEGFRSLKIHLLHQVIDYLNPQDSLVIAAPLLDTFQHYLDDPKISRFCEEKITKFQASQFYLFLNKPTLVETTLLLKFLSRKLWRFQSHCKLIGPAKARGLELTFLRENSASVNVVLACDGTPHEQKAELSARWKDLVTKYVTIEGITTDERLFVEYAFFFALNQTQTHHHLLMLERQEFAAFLEPEARHPLQVIIAYSKEVSNRCPDAWGPRETVTLTVALFPSIHAKNESIRISSFLAEFFMSILPEKPESIRSAFQDAIRVRNRATPFGLLESQESSVEVCDSLLRWVKGLCYPGSVEALLETASKRQPAAAASETTRAYQRVLLKQTQGLALTPTTLSTIEDSFKGLLSDPSSQEEKAVLYVSLAFNFIYLNSSKMFGLHDDSPLPIRLAGLAFLNQAFSLIQGFSAAHPLKSLEGRKREWHNNLMGIGGAFTCTGMISWTIYTELQQVLGASENMLSLTRIVSVVIPELWRPR